MLNVLNLKDFVNIIVHLFISKGLFIITPKNMISIGQIYVIFIRIKK